MRATEKKLQIDGNAMPAVVEPEFTALLTRGRQLFSLFPVPNADAVSCAPDSTRSEIDRFLSGRPWDIIALAEPFEGRGNESIDLGDIPRALSRLGLRYYLPGMPIPFTQPNFSLSPVNPGESRNGQFPSRRALA